MNADTPTANIWNSSLTACATTTEVTVADDGGPRIKHLLHVTMRKGADGTRRVCRYQVAALAPCETLYLPCIHFEVTDYGTARKARAAARRRFMGIVRNHRLALRVDG